MFVTFENNKNIRMRRFFLALGLLLVALRAPAASLFDSDEVLEIQLTGPLATLVDDKFDREELPFVLHTEGVDQNIEVRTRGKSRMRKCGFPPLRLDIDSEESTGTLFDGQDKIKLVTHCLIGSSGQANVLEEFSAYKIFNLLTDVSYRVRLAKVTYVDTDGQLDDVVSNAFLIESDKELAARTNSNVVETPNVRRSALNRYQASLVYIFQYLIANTDWSLVASEGEEKCCHNGDLFEKGSELFYVPFDFDLSGLVNARYAKPDPGLRISKVTSRLYRGYCVVPGALKAALTSINSLEGEILAVFNGIPGLSDKEIKAAQKFLNRFFRESRDEQALLRRFERSCI
jgi:hypothetical protein